MFGRRNQQPVPAGALAVMAMPPVGVPVIPALTAGPAPGYVPCASPQLGNAGWRALPGYIDAAQQKGAYAGSMLNQYPANIPGVQLSCGRERANSRWNYPTATPLGAGATNLQQSQQHSNLAGGQRWQQRYTGGIGPLSAQRNAARVTMSQIRQSGLQAMGWAARLNPANIGS